MKKRLAKAHETLLADLIETSALFGVQEHALHCVLAEALSHAGIPSRAMEIALVLDPEQIDTPDFVLYLSVGGITRNVHGDYGRHAIIERHRENSGDTGTYCEILTKPHPLSLQGLLDLNSHNQDFVSHVLSALDAAKSVAEQHAISWRTPAPAKRPGRRGL